MGIGTIPDAVLKCLTNHKDLGVHTEMLSDGVIDLIQSDVINNKYKGYHDNKTITSFCFGTRKLYDYVDDNTVFDFKDVSDVNFPINIMRNKKMVAINSAIEIDLTGQVCADSIGTLQYSGIGGQMDFMRGAALVKTESLSLQSHQEQKKEFQELFLILNRELVWLLQEVTFIM
jgi:acyl-CoA hydrolase